MPSTRGDAGAHARAGQAVASGVERGSRDDDVGREALDERDDLGARPRPAHRRASPSPQNTVPAISASPASSRWSARPGPTAPAREPGGVSARSSPPMPAKNWFR